MDETITPSPVESIPDRRGLSRRTFLRLTGGAGAVLAVPVLASDAASAPAAIDANIADTALLPGFSDFASHPPFSFTYNGRPSALLLKRWPHHVRSVSSTDDRAEEWVTWVDPETELQVRAVVISYPRYGATEWTIYFTNTARSTSPALGDVLAADVILNRSPVAHYTLHHFNGSANQADDYAPIETSLQSGTRQLLYPAGGRPSNGTWPYFNVDWGNEGLMAAVGWPGQWSAELLPDPQHGLLLKAGMTSADPQKQTYDDIQDAQLLNTTLEPEEVIRTPLMVLMSWRADNWMLAQNKWRRWMTAYNLPRFGGKLPTPIIPTTGSLSLFPDQAQEFTTIDDSVKEHTTRDRGGHYTHWWVDAGWYAIPDGSENWFDGAGDWYPDPYRFPDGMSPTFDRAEAHDMKSILWSEPERVMPDTWLALNHPEWLIDQVGVDPADQVFLFNFGNSDAWSWAVEHFDGLIRSQGASGKGLDVFRQDFNMDPLDYWNSADAPGRSGMTQIKHVVGHMAFWDELRRRHTDMWIDSCASGGRRNDLESMRRAVPLLRSDYQFEPTGNQCQTYGISFWLPYYGTGVGPQATNNGAWGSGQYVVRSSLAPCYASSIDFSTATQEQYRVLQQMNDDFVKIEDDLLYSDFYPLTAFSLGNDVWMALQFHRPEIGRGAVLVFRRPGASEPRMSFRLHGLVPRHSYRVENLDIAGSQTSTGGSLTNQGVTVSLPEAPAAAILSYVQLNS